MKKLFTLLTAVAVLSSCSITKTGSSKSIDVLGAGVLHIPVIAELDVQSKKQELTKTFSNVKSIETAKNEVVRELLQKFSADVLVEPTYESSTKNGTTVIAVKGFPASYKNFRNIVESDVKLLEVSPAYLQKPNTNISAVEKLRGKK